MAFSVIQYHRSAHIATRVAVILPFRVIDRTEEWRSELPNSLPGELFWSPAVAATEITESAAAWLSYIALGQSRLAEVASTCIGCAHGLMCLGLTARDP